MTTAVPPGQDEQSRRVRALVYLAAALTLAVLVVVFVEARERQRNAPVVLGPDSVDLVVTAPVEIPEFADAILWNLPSSQVVHAQRDGFPVVRLASLDSVPVVGLRGPDGIVALAMVPPGLDSAPPELLISPASTALALIALHPAIASADADTLLAAVATAVTAPSFADLAAQVDGRALVDWTDAERELLQRVVGEATLADAEPTCAEGEQIAEFIWHCPGDVTFNNTGARTALILDQDLEICTALPPRTASVAETDRATVAQVLGTGGVPVSVRSTAVVSAGIAGAADCGADARAADGSGDEPADPDLIALANRLSFWHDNVVPLARLIGVSPAPDASDRTDSSLQAVLDAPVVENLDLGTPVGRMQGAAHYVGLTTTAFQLDILPPSPDTIRQLDRLVDLLEVLYT